MQREHRAGTNPCFMIGGTLGSGKFDFTAATVCETTHARSPAWDCFAPNYRTYGLDPEDYLTEVLTRLHHNATTRQPAAIPPPPRSRTQSRTK